MFSSYFRTNRSFSIPYSSLRSISIRHSNSNSLARRSLADGLGVKFSLNSSHISWEHPFRLTFTVRLSSHCSFVAELSCSFFSGACFLALCDFRSGCRLFVFQLCNPFDKVRFYNSSNRFRLSALFLQRFGNANPLFSFDLLCGSRTLLLWWSCRGII